VRRRRCRHLLAGRKKAKLTLLGAGGAHYSCTRCSRQDDVGLILQCFVTPRRGRKDASPREWFFFRRLLLRQWNLWRKKSSTNLFLAFIFFEVQYVRNSVIFFPAKLQRIRSECDGETANSKKVNLNIWFWFRERNANFVRFKSAWNLIEALITYYSKPTLYYIFK
jgi:hypothetical protein